MILNKKNQNIIDDMLYQCIGKPELSGYQHDFDLYCLKSEARTLTRVEFDTLQMMLIDIKEIMMRKQNPEFYD
jgi:hypothetical protein